MPPLSISCRIHDMSTRQSQDEKVLRHKTRLCHDDTTGWMTWLSAYVELAGAPHGGIGLGTHAHGCSIPPPPPRNRRLSSWKVTGAYLDERPMDENF